MAHDTHDETIDETVLSYFVQHGRSAVVSDVAHVADITGLSAEDVRRSLTRLEGATRVIRRSDGSWIRPDL